MRPAADNRATTLTCSPQRASKPFVLRTIPGRLRADGNTAEAKRWQDICDDLLGSLAPGRTVLDLTTEARTLVEQVCDLTLQSDLLRAALLRGEDVEVDHTVRVSVATERHLSALKKLRLLREEPKPASRARAYEETKPTAPAFPSSTNAVTTAVTAQGITWTVRVINLPVAATEAHARALAEVAARQSHPQARYPDLDTSGKAAPGWLLLDCQRTAMAELLRDIMQEEDHA
jgi:hypothetical protein